MPPTKTQLIYYGKWNRKDKLSFLSLKDIVYYSKNFKNIIWYLNNF